MQRQKAKKTVQGNTKQAGKKKAGLDLGLDFTREVLGEVGEWTGTTTNANAQHGSDSNDGSGDSDSDFDDVLDSKPVKYVPKQKLAPKP